MYFPCKWFVGINEIICVKSPITTLGALQIISSACYYHDYKIASSPLAL